MEFLNNDNVPLFILQKSNLSWDEAQLIKYLRSHPEQFEKILNLLKDGEIIAKKKQYKKK